MEEEGITAFRSSPEGDEAFISSPQLNQYPNSLEYGLGNQQSILETQDSGLELYDSRLERDSARLDTREFSQVRESEVKDEDREELKTEPSSVPSPIYPRADTMEKKERREGKEGRMLEKEGKGEKEGREGKVGRERFLGKARTLTREEIIHRYCQDGEVPL